MILQRVRHMSKPTTILWLRRDLRLHDHPALIAAAEDARASGGKLLPGG